MHAAQLKASLLGFEDPGEWEKSHGEQTIGLAVPQV